MKNCTETGCERKTYGRGLCKKHYLRAWMVNKHHWKASKISESERFERQFIPEPNSGCWLWMGGGDNNNYGRVRRNKKTLLAHRYSWSLYRGEIPEGMNVLHKCDNPCCVNPNHLFLGTQQDNVSDMIEKNRYGFSFMPSSGRLTNEQVAKIRELHTGKYGDGLRLAKMFNISPSQISRLVTKRTALYG